MFIRPCAAGAVLQTPSLLIISAIHPFPPNLQNIKNYKPLELESNILRLFRECVMCHMSCVMCQMSHVMCNMSCVICHMLRVTCHVSQGTFLFLVVVEILVIGLFY